MSKHWVVIAFLIFFTAVGTSVLAGDIALTPMEQLGKSLYFDKISEPNSMSCADCHAPRVGFTGPIGGINKHGAVYRGAVPKRFGNRKPPAASYATFSPIFDFDEGEGLFVGGNFWDGRATGEKLGNPAADQALGPFLNPVEQNNPSKMVVLQKVASSKYAGLWEDVWGEPISVDTPEDVEANYDRIGLAIAAFEASKEVNPFSSKFDVFWQNANDASMDVTDIDMSNWMGYAGLGLNSEELRGLALFNDESKGKCALCHVLDPGPGGVPPLFTDFTFDNLGVPKNPKNPFYNMDRVYLDDGTPVNPEGADWVDPGLGGFLASHSDPEWQAMAAENLGKHKVPTLRNVGKRPEGKDTTPRLENVDMPPHEGFPKAYMHNGVLKSLKEVVHFYNTRDVEDWPDPEVPENVNTDELGDLGLTDSEENAIVAFMETLSDGYADPWMPPAPVQGSSSLDIGGPNPFNPSTIIRFELSKPSHVRLDVFNVRGQWVKTLVEGWRTVGEHRVVFDADNLSSGVYFLRLATSDQTLTRKAILLK
ncbi:MAG: T9SS type A sorting domain-containing protein [Candidatus Latescibacterota bacterium]|nr:MAG: T9SS type A sorting domain-containing protein [Candidatus Latescibacterota bacterium]